MSDWRDIGVRISELVAKEPTYIQIAIGLAAAFTALMILEGLRASFFPKRREETPRPRRPRFATALFRSAPANAARLPRNPKRRERVVKPHRAARPVIRRNLTKGADAVGDLPQVSSFGD